jgi:type II secretory pathway component PulM
MVGTGWQLLEGVAALLVSVAVSYWLFVAPSRARRVRRQEARDLRDPRDQ